MDMNMNMNIPLGFRFDPTDEELVVSYLLQLATGHPLLPSGADHPHILERNLYGDSADPWLVFAGVPDAHWDVISDNAKDRRVMYVVTKLTKISKGKTRIARRAGCGTWSGQTPPKKIYDESGQWVGTMRMLSFERRNDSVRRDPRDQHHWIMHEYSLDGIYNPKGNCKIINQDYVICRIKREFDNKSRPKKRSSRDGKKEEEIATTGRGRKKQKKKAAAIIGDSSSSPSPSPSLGVETTVQLPDGQFPEAQKWLPWTLEDMSFFDYVF